MGIPRIHTEASTTARPFFEHDGFRVREAQTVVQSGAELTNFAMDKTMRRGRNKSRLLG